MHVTDAGPIAGCKKATCFVDVATQGADRGEDRKHAPAPSKTGALCDRMNVSELSFRDLEPALLEVRDGAATVCSHHLSQFTVNLREGEELIRDRLELGDIAVVRCEEHRCTEGSTQQLRPYVRRECLREVDGSAPSGIGRS